MAFEIGVEKVEVEVEKMFCFQKKSPDYYQTSLLAKQ
jgi:hypothetical protein